MTQQDNDFDEIGLKVQRAQQQLDQIQGVGIVNRIRVVVDAHGRLISVSVDQEEDILAAYHAAVSDAEPKVDDALKDLRADRRLSAISTHVAASAERQKVEQAQAVQEYEDEDDDYYEQRNLEGWFEES